MAIAHRGSSLSLGPQHDAKSFSPPLTSSIQAVANARIYHTTLDAKKDDWTYSRLKGTLNFGRNWSTKTGDVKGKSEGQHWFILSDEATGKTVWMFHVPSAFQYEVDRPFFHVFNGRTRKYGFLFEDDDEASIFSTKVMSEACKNAPQKRGRSFRARHHSRSNTFGARSISRSQISVPAPNSFRHVSHIGVNRGGVFEVSKNLDTSFRDMLMQLQHVGHGTETINGSDQGSFVVDFWNDVNGNRTSTISALQHPPVAVSY